MVLLWVDRHCARQCLELAATRSERGFLSQTLLEDARTRSWQGLTHGDVPVQKRGLTCRRRQLRAWIGAQYRWQGFSGQGRRDRQLLGSRGRQVRGIPADAGKGGARNRATDRRIFRQHRMQGGRYPSRQPRG